MNCNNSIASYDTDGTDGSLSLESFPRERRGRQRNQRRGTNSIPHTYPADNATHMPSNISCPLDRCQPLDDCQKYACRFQDKEFQEMIGLKLSSCPTQKPNDIGEDEIDFDIAPTVSQSSSSKLANPCTPLANESIRMHLTIKKTTTESSTPTTSSGSSSSSSSSCCYNDDNQSGRTRFVTNKTRRSRTRTQLESTNQERSRHISPPPSASDLVVVVGNHEFHHSSAILAYASDYLKRKMVQRNQHGQYCIDFSSRSPDEWKMVLEFLQPRSLGTAEITLQVLPVILPWFAEFKLKLLLKDIDMYLMETVVVSQTDGKDVDFRTLTIPNLLLLAYIGHSSELETVKSQSRQWLRAKLSEPQQLPQEIEEVENEDNGALDWTLENLQLLSQMLADFEDLREYLWESSLIIYLPHDLNVQDSLGLVSNCLFPYMLREGMVQLCIVQRAQHVIQQQNSTGMSSSLSPAFSRTSSSSSSTIPAHPQLKRPEPLTQEMLHDLLDSIKCHLEKFQKESELGKVATSSKQRGRRKERRRFQRPKVHLCNGRKEIEVAHVYDELRIVENFSELSEVAQIGLQHRTFEC